LATPDESELLAENTALLKENEALRQENETLFDERWRSCPHNWFRCGEPSESPWSALLAECDKVELARTLLSASAHWAVRLHLELLDPANGKTLGADKMAHADAADGHLLVFVWGQAGWHSPEVAEALRKEYGIRPVSLCSGRGGGLEVQFMTAYNKVSHEAIQNKTGKTFGEILKSKPIEIAAKQAGERRRAESRKWAEISAEVRRKWITALREKVWPQIEKGDFREAQRVGGREFSRLHKEYVTSQHGNISDYEMAFRTRLVSTDFSRTPLVEVLQFLNSWTKLKPQGKEPKIGPFVLEAPEAKKKELLEREVTVRAWPAPISLVIEQCAKQTGLKVRVEADRVVLHLPVQ